MVEQFATMNRRRFSYRFRPCDAVRMTRGPLAGLTGDLSGSRPTRTASSIAGLRGLHIILPAASVEIVDTLTKD